MDGTNSKQSEVRVEVEVYKKNAEMFSQAYLRLVERLTSITKPQPPSQVDASKDSACIVPLAEELRKINRGFSASITDLNDLTDRLEL